MRQTLVRAAAAILMTACANSVGPSGTVNYVIDTDAGAPLIRGTMTLRTAADSTVTGTWRASWISGVDRTIEVGPQTGAGDLTGRIGPDGTIALDMTPGYQDNNVGIVATLGASGWMGTWGWDAFNGPRAQGRFQATAPPIP